ncbi:hypothetical protein N7456_003120 [Penicillium angulare]|uniref:Calcineurin-like phosphoesterase domain-containing protein n=1 Tax=Penicillium angulare TaxID=116970 RepID=A0A9W9FUP2_9EURO|nr:hypothetical protein N7456_003120 [Penicillium angulare]
MPERVKTRICMISDTHTNTPVPASFTTNPFRNPLPEADVLIHAGDLTVKGFSAEYEKTISMLKAAKAELKIVIAGNHDLTLDEEYYSSYGYRRHRIPIRLDTTQSALENEEQSLMRTIRNGEVPPIEALNSYTRHVKELWTSQSARDAGIRYLEEGVHSFILSNGAKLTVYASPYQPEFFRWAFAYNRSEDRYNLPLPGSTAPPPQNPVPDHPDIDIMLTHGPPYGILDRVGDDAVNYTRDYDPDSHVGCKNLLRAAERTRPRVYLFGHIHEAWGAVRGTWDMFANGRVKQEPIILPQEEMAANRGAFYDISSESDRPLQFGGETLFVNASICTLSYRATNAPWVIDLDLPVAETEALAQGEKDNTEHK